MSAALTTGVVEEGVERTALKWEAEPVVVVWVAKLVVVVEGLVATEEVVVLVEGTRIQTEARAVGIMIVGVTYAQILAIFSTTPGN